MYTRKHYFIKKGLQTRFIWTILLIIFLVMVIISCNLLFFATYLQNELDGAQIKEVGKIWTIVMENLYDKLILLAVVNLIIIVVISLFFSHQIAGPIFKMELIMKRIREGHVHQRLKFRQTDNLDDLADQFNETVDYLSTPYAQIAEAIGKLERSGAKGEAAGIAADLKRDLAIFLAPPEAAPEPPAEPPAGPTAAA